MMRNLQGAMNAVADAERIILPLVATLQGHLIALSCMTPLLSSDLPVMIPCEQCQNPLTFLLSRLQTASLFCLPRGLVILATWAPRSRSALLPQTPQHAHQLSTTVGLGEAGD